MFGNGAVCGLKLIFAVRRHKHGSHHGERAERRGNHVAHHIAVIVFAGPDKSAGGAHHACHGVIDQRVEIAQAESLEIRAAGFEFLLKDSAEVPVIGFADGVLGGKPEILPAVHCIAEARFGKAADAVIQVELPQPNGGAVYFLDREQLFLTACTAEKQRAFAGLLRGELCCFIDIPESVAGYGDGLLPAPHGGFHEVNGDGGTEDRSAHDGADSRVGGGVELFQLGVLLHAFFVGRDGRTFHSHSEPYGSLPGLNGDTVVGIVSV